MDSSSIICHLHSMAVSTVNRFQIIGVWKAFIGSIGMTGKTAVTVMNRAGKNGGVHKHGNRFAMEHACHLFILVAHHAVLVGLGYYKACKRTCK